MKNTLSFNKRNVSVIAHRGLSGIETENTAAAFVAAGNRSYYGIETDIHRTADGKYVCLHDADTFRVSGKNCNVNENIYKDIVKIKFNDASCGTGPREDLVAPLMEDYFSICRRYGKRSVLELKDVFNEGELKEIFSIAEKAEQLDDTVFITFYPQNVYLLRALLPEQPCQFLTDRLNDEMTDILLKYKVDIDILYTALDEKAVKTLKSRGIKINCWTVNDVSAAERLAEWGVDFITTNILE
ncbi:MAG: hypothetical protein J6Z34_05785 [Clostridia bacterium]|nr:hypothetical protein [Clostridia bacterium]